MAFRTIRVRSYYRKGRPVRGHTRFKGDWRGVVKRSHHQTGKTNFAADFQRKAEKPGKRRSEAGNVYYEHRRNRSDVGKYY